MKEHKVFRQTEKLFSLHHANMKEAKVTTVKLTEVVIFLFHIKREITGRNRKISVLLLIQNIGNLSLHFRQTEKHYTLHLTAPEEKAKLIFGKPNFKKIIHGQNR